MRISDWSSDVCSSDLTCRRRTASPVGVTVQCASTVSAFSMPVAPASIVEVGAQVPSGARQAKLPLTLPPRLRSEEHTSELQSLMRISYAVFCLKKKQKITTSSQDN